MLEDKEQYPQNSEGHLLFSTNNSLLSHFSIKPECKLKPFLNSKGFKIFISHAPILMRLLEDTF